MCVNFVRLTILDIWDDYTDIWKCYRLHRSAKKISKHHQTEKNTLF